MPDVTFECGAGVALATRLQLADACMADPRADNDWVFRRVVLYLGWRWWADLLHRLPDAQLDGLRGEAHDGLGAADSVLYGLAAPTPKVVNRAMQIGLGLGLLMMHAATLEPFPEVARFDRRKPPVRVLDLTPPLGIRGLPNLPRVGESRTTAWLPRCVSLPKAGIPTSHEDGPLALAREMAWWLWDASAGRVAVCAHGVTHDRKVCPPDGTEALRGRIGKCDGCCVDAAG